jgi:Flp pilus assembly protein TadD
MQNSILNRSILHIFLVAILTLIAYSNTFESPFYFDDNYVIIKNPIIKDLSYFTEPSSARDFEKIYYTFIRRYIGYLTFALNYKLHGLNVTGYHIFNLFVHICMSLLLYFFIILTFMTPSLRNSVMRDYARYIAFFTALLFACHPLQTQAVTYIWQRVTSLCSMFYLLSLVAYIKCRLTREGTGLKTISLYVIALISAILAMKTKEIAFMLPVMLVLYEMIFFEGKIKKRVLYLFPFLVTMLITPLTLMSIDQPIGEMIGEASETMRGHTRLTRGEYLLTELRVLITYLRLIFLPVNQNLDYDYPRFYSFLNIEVLSSFLFLVALFGLSVYILFRYRETMRHIRLMTFGIIWFFINLLLESSIIPLDNVIFEHRMYLSSVGVFIALTVAIFMVIDRWKVYTRIITVMLAVVIVVLTGATYARNAVWKDEITLWQDVVNKSPNKLRGHNNLGLAYKSQGLIDKAIEQYQISIKLNPGNKAAHINLGNAYASLGLLDKEGYNKLGNDYASQNDPGMAIKQYLMAIKLDPNYTTAHINLGNAYASLGILDKAMKHYHTAKKFEPSNPLVHYNIGRVYHMKGSINSAIEHYLLVIKFKPDHAKAHRNLGVAYESAGNIELAIRAYNNAIRLQPGWELPRKELEQISKNR